MIMTASSRIEAHRNYREEAQAKISGNVGDGFRGQERNRWLFAFPV
jgi:hypothetical protein